MADSSSGGADKGDEPGVRDSLRSAIERTLAATAPAAAETRERAGGLVGGISRRGQEAREELARRGGEAGSELARLGQDARKVLAKRSDEASGEIRGQLDMLERRLASIEDLLKGSGSVAEEPAHPQTGMSKPEVED